MTGVLVGASRCGAVCEAVGGPEPVVVEPMVGVAGGGSVRMIVVRVPGAVSGAVTGPEPVITAGVVAGSGLAGPVMPAGAGAGAGAGCR